MCQVLMLLHLLRLSCVREAIGPVFSHYNSRLTLGIELWTKQWRQPARYSRKNRMDNKTVKTIKSNCYCGFFFRLKNLLLVSLMISVEGVKGVEMVAVRAKCLPYGLKFKHKRSRKTFCLK